jgi:2-polyprenyl-3-methyl-5-hydroxy-6-metoxy-1,4-benzoquinol methylase
MAILDNPEILRVLACPWDHTALRVEGGGLTCKQGHQFPVEHGIPVFTEKVRREALPGNMEAAPESGVGQAIDSFVNQWLVNTHGNLYWGARGKLRRYPIPPWPLGEGQGKRVVDIGCSWGRWSIAAARAGYLPIGVDVHIDALAAGRRVAKQLGVQADYVCSEADRLPFLVGSIDLVFSYSVLQHLDREAVRRIFGEAARILKPQGICLVQMPNRSGIFNLIRQMQRGFRDGAPGTFEMRYWSRAQIRKMVEEAGLGELQIRADGFFTQNPQLADLDILSFSGKLVVVTSYAGCRVAALLPFLTRLADSFWVEARKA